MPPVVPTAVRRRIFGHGPMNLRRVWSLAVVAVALAGCQNPFIENPVNSEEFILAAGWVWPRPAAPKPTYCYRTLAKVDCYDQPQPDYAHRIVSYYGPDRP